jgi:hypothetical protein
VAFAVSPWLALTLLEHDRRVGYLAAQTRTSSMMYRYAGDHEQGRIMALWSVAFISVPHRQPRGRRHRVRRRDDGGHAGHGDLAEDRRDDAVDRDGTSGRDPGCYFFFRFTGMRTSGHGEWCEQYWLTDPMRASS